MVVGRKTVETMWVSHQRENYYQTQYLKTFHGMKVVLQYADDRREEEVEGRKVRMMWSMNFKE